MRVFQVTSEWDLGYSDGGQSAVWETEEAARRDIKAALDDQGFDETLEELEDRGLVNFFSTTVIS